MIEMKYDVPMKQFFEEESGLCAIHWEEIANNKDKVKLAPNIEQFVKMQEAGLLKNIVAYDEGLMVGYVVLLISPHLHYRNDKFAFVDLIYVDPVYRSSNIGLKLLNETERVAREEGVAVLQHHAKPHHKNLQTILEKRKGFKVAEVILSKYLGD